MSVLKQKGRPHRLIIKCKIIGTHKFLVFIYTAPKYIPKGISIDKYTDDDIIMFAYSINSLPRKILNYFTSEEMFEKYLDEIYSSDNVVS